MKTTMNFTTSSEDVIRYETSAELRSFYEQFGIAGLELMYMGEDEKHLLEPDMIVGIHANCLTDWMHLDRAFLLEHYRKDLDYAKKIGAEYVVFHVTQVSAVESLTYQTVHTDEEVIDAAVSLINELLDNQSYSFHFLMENLWWPGLNFKDPAITKRLIDGVHYEKKGLMLDTGHFMNQNLDLRTANDALERLHKMLDEHQEFIPYIKGLHLNQSFSGTYVTEYLKHPAIPEEDPGALFTQLFEHIFKIDLHQPFAAPGVKEFVERIAPLYVTFEYITNDVHQHAQYLKAGSDALR